MNAKAGAILLAGLTMTATACATTHRSAMDVGRAQLDTGHYQAAADVYDAVIRAHPESAAAWNNRAIARAHLGDPVAALGDYTQAIQLAPNDPELYFNRGDAYAALGNYDYAIQDFNHAILLAPNYAKAYFNRGTARLRMGDSAGADADWRYGIALEPDPWTQAAMVRSAGLGTPPVRAAVAAIPGTLPRAVAMAPAAPGVVTPPPSVAVTPAMSSPSASPSLEPVTPPSIDARTLTTRAIGRDLDGDRAGALADLRAAAAIETDAARRARIEQLLRSLEAGR